MKARNKNRILYIMIIVAVIIVCVIFGTQIVKIGKSNQELEQKKAGLERLVEEEQSRAAELEDEEAYVNTRDYIEKKAKSIGYVYPDEIVFKKGN